MADTRVQLEAEDWVRREFLPKALGGTFHRERVKLEPGGVFDCDAVSPDHTTAVVISTSTCRTSTGKHAVGKTMKIRADILFLLMALSRRKAMVLTDKGMHDWCVKEQGGGRLPRHIEFLHAELPGELAVKLAASQKVASDEVRPRA
jgi:hypothetical protein